MGGCGPCPFMSFQRTAAGLVEPVPGVVSANPGDTLIMEQFTSTAWDGDAKNGASGTIDLSAVFGVPASVKAITCRFSIRDETTNVIGRLSQDSDPQGFGIVLNTQISNRTMFIAGIVPCDSNGDIYFSQNGELDNVTIVITGYWE